MKNIVKFSLIAFSLAFTSADALASVTSRDGADALPVLTALSNATNFENTDHSAGGVSADPRFMRNQFSMFLAGALGADIAGWGDIRITNASCDRLMTCTTTIMYANADHYVTYRFKGVSTDGVLTTNKVYVTYTTK